jgi:hypothetical protein
LSPDALLRGGDPDAILGTVAPFLAKLVTDLLTPTGFHTTFAMRSIAWRASGVCLANLATSNLPHRGIGRRAPPTAHPTNFRFIFNGLRENYCGIQTQITPMQTVTSAPKR